MGFLIRILYSIINKESSNDQRDTKRLNRNRTNNRMGKSCIKYK